MSAGGIAGVWSTANTREAIAAAFKRKEVYATTGPRISLRVFGGCAALRFAVEPREVQRFDAEADPGPHPLRC